MGPARGEEGPEISGQPGLAGMVWVFFPWLVLSSLPSPPWLEWNLQRGARNLWGPPSFAFQNFRSQRCMAFSPPSVVVKNHALKITQFGPDLGR